MKLKLILTALFLTIANPVATALAKDTELVRGEVILLTSLAGDYTTIGQPEQAIQILEEALALNQRITAPCPKLEILADVAGHYAFAGQETESSALFTQARGILEVTKKNGGCGIEPSSSGWNDPETWIAGAVVGHLQAGRNDIALRIARSFGESSLEEILEILSLNYNGPGLVEILSELTEHYRRTGQDDKINSSPQAPSPQEQAQKKQKKLHRCFVPEEADTLSSIRQIIDALDQDQLSQILQICEGVELAEQMPEVPVQTFKALEQTVLAAQGIADPIERIPTIIAVANIYAQLQEETEANQLLNQALSELQIVTDFMRGDSAESSSLSIADWKPILEAYVQAGKTERAIQLANDLSGWDRASALGTIAQHSASQGQYQQAIETALMIESPHINTVLHLIARHSASQGQYQQAIETALMIEALEFENKASILYNIIQQAIEAEDLDWAMQTIQSINWTREATRSILQELESAQDISLLYRNKLLLAIARQYSESMQFDRALEVVEKMDGDVIGNIRRVKALAAIARQYAEVGQPGEATRLLKQAVDIARSISPL